MDEKPKKRPFFQFHLSTAIMLMFVAGAMEFAFFRYCKFLAQQSPGYWKGLRVRPETP